MILSNQNFGGLAGFQLDIKAVGGMIYTLALQVVVNNVSSTKYTLE